MSLTWFSKQLIRWEQLGENTHKPQLLGAYSVFVSENHWGAWHKDWSFPPAPGQLFLWCWPVPPVKVVTHRLPTHCKSTRKVTCVFHICTPITQVYLKVISFISSVKCLQVYWIQTVANYLSHSVIILLLIILSPVVWLILSANDFCSSASYGEVLLAKYFISGWSVANYSVLKNLINLTS